MGRVAKKAPAQAAKEIEDSPMQTITQTRTRRTPKPNPKYNESVILPLKAESSDTLGSSDGEDLPAEIKIVKSVKKSAETPASVKAIKTPAAKGKAVAAKKQKLDYDDEEEEEEKAVDEDKPAPRSTRSAKGDSKDTLKIGDDSVAIVEISSIISKGPAKADSPKNLRGAGRKRAVPEETQKEDQAKKKKEEEKPSLITARKSYMPSQGLGKRGEIKEKTKEVKDETEDTEDETEVKVEAAKTPASTMKTRRNAGAPAESPQAEVVEKKLKVEDVKIENVKPEGKKLPILRKSEQITKVATPVAVVRTPGTLPTKAINASTAAATVGSLKPVPRILNSMITPKGKQSPNVKLAGDGTDKKVFSIDLTDDSIKEKKALSSPVKMSPLRSPVAVKENVANNKPQPSTLLKNKLESELMRMKASASMMRRQMIPQHAPAGRLSLPTQNQVQAGHNASLGARRITKFESWYVIDVKNLEPSSFRHTHTHSLISLGNNIKDLQLPSTKWDYKVTLQRRLPRKENNNDEEEEVYTGDVNDKSIEVDKANFEPSSILFKRSHRESNKISIDRSLMLKQNMYTITMNGKQCKLIGAPEDIKTIEDLEILLNIIDSSTLQHSCVELVTSHDIITIS